uniref:DNA-directed RNA polymerase n=1 Tax=viral metagenome TaxID=1070528 RepID=A0A6C0AFH0_9ZZZZ
MYKEEFTTWAKNIEPFYIPELKRSKEGNLQNKLIKEYSFSKNIIEIFDHWIDNTLDYEIKAKHIKTDSGIIKLSFHHLETPRYGPNSNKLLFPKTARDKSLSYMGRLFLNAHFIPNDITIHKEYSEIFVLGKIPILLGSKYCNLSTLTFKEFLESGECPNDTLGYNIIKGTERVIVIQEKLRESQFFVFLHTDAEAKLEGRVTCSSFSGTTVVIFSIGKQWKTLKIKLFHMKGGKHIPLFILFLFLGIDINSAVSMILEFIRPENREEAKIKLQPSIAKTSAHYRNAISYWRIKRNLNNELRNEEALKIIIDDINKELFSDIPTDETPYEDYIKVLKKDNKRNNINNDFIPFQVPQTGKAKQLALSTARIIETINNNRPLDNRDNWANKRLVTSGASYEALFVNMYDMFITKATEDLAKCKYCEGQPMIRKISTLHKMITEQSEVCFNSNSWGLKGMKRQENITNLITRESPLSVMSQLKKINTPTSRKAKSEGIRSIQGSQFGVVCLAETPEGENCGLVKACGMTTYISLERFTNDILELLESEKKYFNKYEQTEFLNYPFLINGRNIGWCNKKIVKIIVSKRRKLKLPKDICIIFNEADNTVEYYCNSSRPLRPLLIVENGELLIDKKNLWEEPLEVLYEKGVLELLDVREIEYCYIAFYPKDVKNRFEEIKYKKDLKNKFLKKRSEDIQYNKYFDYFLKLEIKTKKKIEDFINLLNLLKEYNILSNKDLQILKTNEKFEKYIVYLNLILRNYNFNSLEEFLKFSLELERFGVYYDLLRDELINDQVLNILEKRRLFTHCEIHPINMFGISAGLIPEANSNQAPRLTYQASMGKQASGQYHLMHHERFESYKMLNAPTRPYFESEVAEPSGLNVMPSGQTLTIAIYSDPSDAEDAFIGCQEYFENENIENIKYHVYKSTRKQNQSIFEVFCKPELNFSENSKRYDAIDDMGIPIIGKYVKEGDCIIGKKRKIYKNDESEAREENASIYLGVREQGYIENVLIILNSENNVTIKVKIGILRIQQVGDKMSSRYSQKGTFGEMRPRNKMIRVMDGINKGVVPNLMINSAAFPSRMTEGKVKEILSSKAFLYSAERVNATTFNAGQENLDHEKNIIPEFGLDMQKFLDVLEKNGMNKFGNENMCHPNGKPLKVPVFFGACTYQSLRHHVDDKIQIRARGEIRPVSHQPVGGRASRGGLKLGEMERDALIASGGSSILNERLMRVSDKYKTVFCGNCGNIAISDNLSPRTEKNICGFCKKNAEFGLLTIPYVYKLIYNMLIGVNIKIKHGLKYQISQGGNPLEKYLS